MKDLYGSIDSILTGDADLRAMVGYKQIKDVPVGLEGFKTGISEMTIRRGFQTEGNWKKLIVYYFQPEVLVSDFSPNIRRLPLVVVLHDRVSDLSLYDISERVIELLDGADLTASGKIHSYNCSYDGQIQSPMNDADLKAYKMSIRFSVIARKEKSNARL